MSKIILMWYPVTNSIKSGNLNNNRRKIRPSKYDPKSGPEIPTKDRRTRCEISRELECYIPAKIYGDTLDP